MSMLEVAHRLSVSRNNSSDKNTEGMSIIANAKNFLFFFLINNNVLFCNLPLNRFDIFVETYITTPSVFDIIQR